MSESAQSLHHWQAVREFFIAIDSDGCVFDTMPLRHQECFVPMFIKHFGLQPVSRCAREVWEFVNLHSRSRDIHRFPALSNALNLLGERPEMAERGVAPLSTDALDAWIAGEPRLGNPTLEKAILDGATELTTVLVWSRAVDEIVTPVPPFPLAAESIRRCCEWADVLGISQSPAATLEQDWNTAQLTGVARGFAGSESGTKTDQLRLAAGNKYRPRHVLVVGDAPVDFKAAKANHALFFPIVPGREAASWQQFYDEGIDRFVNDQFAGEYEAALIQEFNEALPERAPWLA